jgi:PAS domain S-box-containing protein
MAILTILVFFCLLSAFTTCALGFFVFGKNPESRVNRLFLASMLGVTFWALGEFFIWQSGSYDGARFWLKASSFWPIAIVIAAHFVLVFTEDPFVQPGKSRILLIALYIAAAVFTLLGLFTDTLFFVTYIGGTGYVYKPDLTSPVFPVETAFFVTVMLWAIVAGCSAWHRAGNEKKKRQLRLLCIAIAAVVGFGALSGIILPVFGIYTPNLVFIGMILFSLIITYAITQYELFTLSAETAVPDILRTMPDGLILADLNGRIITANASAERIFHAGKNGLCSKPVSAIIPEPAYSAIMTTLKTQGMFLDLGAILNPKENTAFSIAGSGVSEPGGEPAGTVLIIRDISSRKMQERALRIANEKISLISQLTRHDINNLVSGLAGYLLLLEETPVPPPGDAYVRTSLDLVDRIGRQLAFSRDYLQVGTYQPDWQSLGAVISRAENDLPHTGIPISVEVPPVEIYADPLAVKVIYNLLENALRHGVHITHIGITASKHDNGELVVLFEDDGIGIAASEKERIFEYGVGDHTGLGLAFTRDILEVTGITIMETGEAGHGSRFELHIPPSAWRRM